MDKVITAKDLANREGHKTVAERIEKLANKYKKRFTADRVAGTPVNARIDYGRWLADCECGGAEYVDPDEPIFFCVSCGNSATNGRARPVAFPEDRKAIEETTMKNPIGGFQCWSKEKDQ